uniref:Uncharacterized protein n=1 Tax=Mycoplasma feriruminatoris TaxID=1179777 RepID=A0A654IS42_9MOLU|nr:hypothetical protein MF5582_00908 [Mycoplasma feriruminatoris]
MIYIDFDWNIVNIWDEDKLIKTEKALILRDLLTKDIIAIGNKTDEEMRKPGNFLSINCTENRKIGSFEDLDIRVKKLIKDNDIKDYRLVNRYNEYIPNLNTISEVEFLKKISKDYDYYVEFRNNEITIFNNQTNEIKSIKKGRAYLQHYIQSIFYLNYNATLNTKKSWDLIKLINQKQEIKTVVCRSLITGIDEDINILNKDFLTNVFQQINVEVNNLLDLTKKIKYDQKYMENFNCVR